MKHLSGYNLLPQVLILLATGIISHLSVPSGSVYAQGSIVAASTQYLHSNSTGRQEPYLVKEYSINKPGNLKVLTVAGNIEVRRHSTTNLVRVELYVERGFAIWSHSRNLDNYRITNIKRGNEIIATVEKKSGDKGFFSDQVTFSYKIYVPDSISTDLTTRGGNITLDGMLGEQIAKSSGGNIHLANIYGEIKAYTQGGNINISKSSGTIYSQTHGGIISLDRCGGELRLRASGGKIVSEQTSGSMVAEVGSGDISAHFVSIDRGITLKTAAGNIFLRVPQMGYELYLRGTKVEFERPANFSGTRNSGFVRGMFMDGGIPVTLTTDSGTITFEIQK